ncbi:phosphoribosyltransferase-like protein [Cupriavidus necator]
MSLLPKASKTQWLAQFDNQDKVAAEQLLSAVDIISSDEFDKTMHYLFRQHFDKRTGNIAMYPEREVKKHSGIPNRFFKEVKTGPRGKKKLTASGASPAPYHSNRGDTYEVGSEGHIATVIGQLSRAAKSANSGRVVLASPAPSLIRKWKVRHFIIITDFIGSGDRITNMLQSMWRVRSVRSWWSYGWIQFHILAYSGTKDGIDHIKSHASKPNVICAKPPRTIDNHFTQPDAQIMRLLCCTYNPDDNKYALGYGGSQVLLGFSHGCPNNMPAIFWSTKKKWSPIFPSRTTFLVTTQSTKSTEQEIASAFKGLGLPHLQNSDTFTRLPIQSKRLLLLLATVNAGARSIEMQSDRSGLSVSEIFELAAIAKHHQLVTDQGHLTDTGAATLAAVSRQSKAPLALDRVSTTYYYPTQLRSPV